MEGARAPARSVARLLHVGIGACSLAAWGSLAAQLDVLGGSRGLLPVAEWLSRVPPDTPFASLPTWLRAGASDGALHLGVTAGMAASLAVLGGVLPRVACAASTFLYLGYAIALRSFLAFQWDNLLLECGALGALLSARAPERWVLLLFRVALFKLYFESGVAKWQSHLGDWQDGSAMAYYYETAPIPTRLAWYAHQLPAAWHRLESWATLALEIGAPFLLFARRRARLATLAVLTAFQALNVATANYGFFSYLAVALHASALDDRDARALLRAPGRVLRRFFRGPAWGRRALARSRRLSARLRLVRRTSRRVAERVAARATPPHRAVAVASLTRKVAAAVVAGGYLLLSLEGALLAFARGSGSGSVIDALGPIHEAAAPFRLVNTYHLFGHITRERIEPTFETFDGIVWTEHDLRFKPGPPSRPPPFVAPHQPRVDFLLWFYGLSYRRGMPEYVRSMLRKLCERPADLAPLFAAPLPEAPRAARVVFHRYRFASAADRARGRYWERSLEAPGPGLECGR